jgi:hypothetical protein
MVGFVLHLCAIVIKPGRQGVLISCIKIGRVCLTVHSCNSVWCVDGGGEGEGVMDDDGGEYLSTLLVCTNNATVTVQMVVMTTVINTLATISSTAPVNTAVQNYTCDIAICAIGIWISQPMKSTGSPWSPTHHVHHTPCSCYCGHHLSLTAWSYT